MTTYVYQRIVAPSLRIHSSTGLMPQSVTVNGLEADESRVAFSAPLADFEKENLDIVMADEGYSYHHAEET